MKDRQLLGGNLLTMLEACKPTTCPRMLLQHAFDSGLQVAHLTEQHQRTQTYNAQLQEYNGKLQGEVQTNAQATSPPPGAPASMCLLQPLHGAQPVDAITPLHAWKHFKPIIQAT